MNKIRHECLSALVRVPIRLKDAWNDLSKQEQRQLLTGQKAISDMINVAQEALNETFESEEKTGEDTKKAMDRVAFLLWWKSEVPCVDHN